MFGGFKSVQRFSLLLLEEGENYLQEYVVDCRWPMEVDGNWSSKPVLSGTLRVCTKSLFFEPDDIRTPVVRIPLRYIQQLEPEISKSFTITTSGLTKMKANNADKPYVFIKNKESYWHFSLLYAAFEQFHTLITEQMALKDNEDLLAERMQERVNSASFDASRLVDFSETILQECATIHILPLVREPGKFVITDQRVYFQSLISVTGFRVVLTHPLGAIAAVSRRRSALKSCSIEVFFVPPDDSNDTMTSVWNSSCAFFEFRSEAEREGVLELLLKKIRPGNVPGGILESEGEWLGKISRAWQYGKISNFDYILYLNLASGRTFNDLRQWPVFPWILQDYRNPVLDLSNPASYRDLSKPVGALNPDRLATFRKRYQQMPRDGFPPPFLYGTHYSTPGYVMFWLVRAAPAHILQLQSGRFDAPDRMFYSVADAWESVTTNPADVKELIPEFFLPNTDFLTNQYNLALGKRQNGKAIDDVQLPPWAETPLDFLAINRAALESEFVSLHLHLWINLIFGCWQTGEAAEEVDNVFYYLSYEGAVDIDSVTDPMERKGLEAQINEFGQTPKQLFKTPHLTRQVIPPTPDPNTLFENYSTFAEGDNEGESKVCATCQHVSNQTLSLVLLNLVSNVAESDVTIDESQLRRSPCFLSASSSGEVETPVYEHERSMKKAVSIYDHVKQQWGLQQQSRQAKIPSGEIRKAVSETVKGFNTKLNAFVDQFNTRLMMPQPLRRQSSEVDFIQSWCPLYFNGMKLKHETNFLQGAVRAMTISTFDGGTLYCAGDNATLKMLSLENGSQIRSAKIERLSGKGIPLSDLDLLSYQEDNMQPLALLGSYDHSVYAYSIEFGRLVGFFTAHDEAVSVVKLMNTSNKCRQLITASLNGSVKVWRLRDGRTPWEELRNTTPEAEIEIVDHDSAVVKVVPCPDGHVIVSGTEEGTTVAWDLRSPGRSMWSVQQGKHSVGGLCVLPDGHHVMCGYKDGTMKIWSMRKPSDIIASVSFQTPVHDCYTDGWISLHGQENGEIAVWDVARSLGLAPNYATLSIPRADGFYAPLCCNKNSTIKTLSVRRAIDLQGNEVLWVAAGQDTGHISVFHSGL